MQKNILDEKQILMNLGGVAFNVGQFSGKKEDEIAEMISKWITDKAEDFQKKPVNVDDLQKMLDLYGLKGSKITAKIKATIAPNLIKPNSNPKEGATQDKGDTWKWWGWG